MEESLYWGLVIYGSVFASVLLIVVLNYFDDRDPINLIRIKRRLSNGVCDNGPYGCQFKDTIEGKPGCTKPPFENCEFNTSPEKYFGDAKTIQEWRENNLKNVNKTEESQ